MKPLPCPPPGGPYECARALCDLLSQGLGAPSRALVVTAERILTIILHDALREVRPAELANLRIYAAFSGELIVQYPDRPQVHLDEAALNPGVPRETIEGALAGDEDCVVFTPLDGLDRLAAGRPTVAILDRWLTDGQAEAVLAALKPTVPVYRCVLGP